MTPGPTLTNLTLTNDPDGWDDVLVRYDRSQNYFGLGRSYTIPLRFIKEGAQALRESFYTFGLAAVFSVEIKKLNRATMQYYSAYTAAVDFNTFKDFSDYVEVQLIEPGLVAMMKENEKTVFNITIPGSRCIVEASRIFIGASFYDVFEALIDKITDGGITSGTYAIKSDELTLYNNSLLLMSTEYGDLLELSPTFHLKTTFADFYKSVRALLNVGLGIQTIAGKQTVIIESLDEFFTNDEILSFTSVNDFEFSVDNTLLFNRVKVGYPEQTYIQKSMVNEVNTTSIFNIFSLNGAAVKELDLTSVYRGDFTGILDLILEDPEQQEYQYFIVKGAMGSGNLFTPDYDGKLKKSDLGTEYDIYNTQWSPRRLLRNHQNFLESCLNARKALSYSSGGNENYRNQTKRTDIIDTYLNESDDISLYPATSLFIPYIFKIMVPLTTDLNSVLSLSSTGYISFTFEGNEYKGFIMSAGVKLAGRGIMELKLLASYDNDLSTLIR